VDGLGGEHGDVALIEPALAEIAGDPEAATKLTEAAD